MITENSLTEAQSIFYNNTKKHISIPGYIPLKLSGNFTSVLGWNIIVIKCISFGGGVFINQNLVEEIPEKSVCIKYRAFSIVMHVKNAIKEVRIYKTGINEIIVNDFKNCCYVPFKDQEFEIMENTSVGKYEIVIKFWGNEIFDFNFTRILEFLPSEEFEQFFCDYYPDYTKIDFENIAEISKQMSLQWINFTPKNKNKKEKPAKPILCDESVYYFYSRTPARIKRFEDLILRGGLMHKANIARFAIYAKQTFVKYAENEIRVKTSELVGSYEIVDTVDKILAKWGLNHMDVNVNRHVDIWEKIKWLSETYKVDNKKEWLKNKMEEEVGIANSGISQFYSEYNEFIKAGNEKSIMELQSEWGISSEKLREWSKFVNSLIPDEEKEIVLKYNSEQICDYIISKISNFENNSAIFSLQMNAYLDWFTIHRQTNLISREYIRSLIKNK